MMPLGNNAGIKIVTNYPLFIAKFYIKTLTFAARSKKTGKQHFLNKTNQGNEQLRIDGDFYPCAF